MRDDHVLFWSLSVLAPYSTRVMVPGFLNEESGNDQIAAVSAIGTEPFVHNLTIDETSQRLATRRERDGREWERPTARVVAPTRRTRRFDAPIAIAAAAGLALAGFAAFGTAESHLAPTPESAPPTAPVEPAVAASDLPLGAMYHVVDQIGARALWEQGFTGSGVNVAVIDTGIAPVESLGRDGKVVAAVDFSADAADPAAAFTDAHGHGTFVSGIIAGSEPGADPARAAQHPESFLGVAPDAGSFRSRSTTPVAGVNPGRRHLRYRLGRRQRRGTRHRRHQPLLRHGLAGRTRMTHSPPLERAWDAGIVVVAAAGNEGAEADGLTSPATDPFLIAVGYATVPIPASPWATIPAAATGFATRTSLPPAAASTA